MNIDHSSWEGYVIDGKVDTVLSRGTVVIEDDTFNGRKGHGRFVKRGLSPVPGLSETRGSDVMKQIDHWIDGKAVAGTSGRTGVVWNPAPASSRPTVAWPRSTRSPPRSPSAKAALPGVAGHRACRAGPR